MAGKVKTSIGQRFTLVSLIRHTPVYFLYTPLRVITPPPVPSIHVCLFIFHHPYRLSDEVDNCYL